MAMPDFKQSAAQNNIGGIAGVGYAQIEAPRTINEQVAEIAGRLHSLADDIGRIGDRLYGPVPSEVKGEGTVPTAGNVASILRDAFRALDAAEANVRRAITGL